MSVLRRNLTEEEKKELWQSEGYAKGYALGYAEGHEKGLAEGLAKCRAEVRIEERAEVRKEVAEKMKALGTSIDFIESVTGLSREAIEAL